MSRLSGDFQCRAAGLFTWDIEDRLLSCATGNAPDGHHGYNRLGARTHKHQDGGTNSRDYLGSTRVFVWAALRKRFIA